MESAFVDGQFCRILRSDLGAMRHVLVVCFRKPIKYLTAKSARIQKQSRPGGIPNRKAFVTKEGLSFEALDFILKSKKNVRRE